jgi:hypothetical protein
MKDTLEVGTRRTTNDGGPVSVAIDFDPATTDQAKLSMAALQHRWLSEFLSNGTEDDEVCGIGDSELTVMIKHT